MPTTSLSLIRKARPFFTVLLEVMKLLSPKVIMLTVGESLYQDRYITMALTIGLPR